LIASFCIQPEFLCDINDSWTLDNEVYCETWWDKKDCFSYCCSGVHFGPGCPKPGELFSLSQLSGIQKSILIWKPYPPGLQKRPYSPYNAKDKIYFIGTNTLGLYLPVGYHSPPPPFHLFHIFRFPIFSFRLFQCIFSLFLDFFLTFLSKNCSIYR
jgi:hypothetical protein